MSEHDPWPSWVPEDLPRSPSGRVPQWVVDERFGVSTPTDSWRTTPAPTILLPPPAPRRRWRAVLAVAVLVVALVVPFALSRTEWDPLARLSGDAQQLAPREADLPTASVEESGVPLGVPEPLVETSPSYAFLAVQDDEVTPVAYDPCRPIHVVIRPDNEPEGGRDMILDALYRVGQATGLVFVDDGATTEIASRDRPVRDEERYGDGWSPLLISWQTTEENPDLVEDVLGQGGSTRIGLTSGGPQVYVTGQVSLDAAQFEETLRQPGGGVIARAAILHELGHVVGLAHVDDPTQLMYPEAQRSVGDFAAGDLTGLSALGMGACVPGLDGVG